MTSLPTVKTAGQRRLRLNMKEQQRDPKLRVGLDIGQAKPLTTPHWVAEGDAIVDPRAVPHVHSSPTKNADSPRSMLGGKQALASPRPAEPLAYKTHHPLPTHGRRPRAKPQVADESQWWRWDSVADDATGAKPPTMVKSHHNHHNHHHHDGEARDLKEVVGFGAALACLPTLAPGSRAEVGSSSADATVRSRKRSDEGPIVKLEISEAPPRRGDPRRARADAAPHPPGGKPQLKLLARPRRRLAAKEAAKDTSPPPLGHKDDQTLRMGIDVGGRNKYEALRTPPDVRAKREAERKELEDLEEWYEAETKRNEQAKRKQRPRVKPRRAAPAKLAPVVRPGRPRDSEAAITLKMAIHDGSSSPKREPRDEPSKANPAGHAAAVVADRNRRQMMVRILQNGF